MFRIFLRDTRAATAIEYVAALIAVAIIGGVAAVGSKLSATFDSVKAGLQ